MIVWLSACRSSEVICEFSAMKKKFSGSFAFSRNSLLSPAYFSRLSADALTSRKCSRPGCGQMKSSSCVVRSLGQPEVPLLAQRVVVHELALELDFADDRDAPQVLAGLAGQADDVYFFDEPHRLRDRHFDLEVALVRERFRVQGVRRRQFLGREAVQNLGVGDGLDAGRRVRGAGVDDERALRLGLVHFEGVLSDCAVVYGVVEVLARAAFLVCVSRGYRWS
jgi:hypothetical protein